MKLAIISPVSHLNKYSSYGTIDMALTHLVLHDMRYADFYRRRSEQGMHIILDNSAFEMEQLTGKGFDPADVLKAAKMIKATELICTDILYDGDATYQSTQDFIQFLRDKDEDDNYLLQAVAQGSNREEWMECYEKLLHLTKVDVIGFSKLSVPKSFMGCTIQADVVTKARQQLINELISSGMTPDKFGKVVHMLGGDNGSPAELSNVSGIEWIRSNDTSAPIQYGLNKVLFKEDGFAEDYVSQKPDLENKYKKTAQMLDKNKYIILQNIIMFFRHIAIGSHDTISIVSQL